MRRDNSGDETDCGEGREVDYGIALQHSELQSVDDEFIYPELQERINSLLGTGRN